LQLPPDAQDCHTFRPQLEALADSIVTGAAQVNASLEDGIACDSICRLYS